MVETILCILLFILGSYFGSFFTLATYRMPKKEDITHKHSYCPSCNHKLGIFDLVPIFSYLFLGGKCHYCKKPIGMRYFLFEILTGIVFVLFGISLKINIYELNWNQITYFILGILYLSSLFILAGINKEKHIVQKSVLFFGVFVSICYMIYSYTLKQVNAYEYVIYLFMMVCLILLDTVTLKKKLKYSNTIQLLILVLYMLIFSGAYITISTVLFTILAIGIENIIKHMKRKKSVKLIKKKEEIPNMFFMCCANIIMIITTNFFINYMMK